MLKTGAGRHKLIQSISSLLKFSCMKKSILTFCLLITGIGVITFTACKKDEPVPAQTDFTTMSYAEVVEKTAIQDPSIVEELNYMIHNSMVCPDEFNKLHNSGVVEFWGEENDAYPFSMCGTDDMGLGRKAIRNLINEEKAQDQSRVAEDRMHRRFTFMYSGGTIPVRVHSNVPAAWKTAINEACAAWNTLGSDIHLSPYSTASNSFLANELDIDYSSLGAGNNLTLAWTQMAMWPGKFGESIIINSTYNNGGGEFNPAAKKLAMVHEIGHAVGLAHTDTNDGWQVPFVPCAQKGQFDPESVMRGSNILPFSPWLGFTVCDMTVIFYYW